MKQGREERVFDAIVAGEFIEHIYAVDVELSNEYRLSNLPLKR